MTVELISVGTEILMGNIVNTNAAYLSRKCADLGLSLYHQTTVGDNMERLCEAVNVAYQRSDILILSGGLGPTQDDMTKEAVSKALSVPLVEDSCARQNIDDYFKRRKLIKMTENNYRQSYVLEGSTALYNDNGTAAGVLYENAEAGKTVILLPGPPSELIPMFEKDCVPYLQSKSEKVILSKMVKIAGVGESLVETMIKDLIDEQDNPTIATYAKTGEVDIRVTASANSKDRAKELLKPMVKELKNRFSGNVFTVDEKETLEQCVVNLLTKNNLTITTAESCTGGLLAGRIVNVSGASSVFSQGIITYANKAKRKYLDVDKSTLKKYGEVSRKTAKEMAKGAALMADADVALSVTGIAGPDGGTEEKPVGLVYIGCYYKGKVEVTENYFAGDRQKVREAAVMAALTLARKCILS